VKISNSCARTLIFGSFLLLPFVKFFPHPFSLFLLSVLLSFLLFRFGFLSSFVFPLLFHSCFVPVFLAHVVSSLAYPNLLGNKMLGIFYQDLQKLKNTLTINFYTVLVYYQLLQKQYVVSVKRIVKQESTFN
jgi:hypothetical protein